MFDFDPTLIPLGIFISIWIGLTLWEALKFQYVEYKRIKEIEHKKKFVLDRTSRVHKL
jgi:hypothetical protein